MLDINANLNELESWPGQIPCSLIILLQQRTIEVLVFVGPEESDLLNF